MDVVVEYSHSGNIRNSEYNNVRRMAVTKGGGDLNIFDSSDVLVAIYAGGHWLRAYRVEKVKNGTNR